jgi:hypothetical protein
MEGLQVVEFAHGTQLVVMQLLEMGLQGSSN